MHTQTTTTIHHTHTHTDVHSLKCSSSHHLSLCHSHSHTYTYITFPEILRGVKKGSQEGGRKEKSGVYCIQAIHKLSTRGGGVNRGLQAVGGSLCLALEPLLLPNILKMQEFLARQFPSRGAFSKDSPLVHTLTSTSSCDPTWHNFPLVGNQSVYSVPSTLWPTPLCLEEEERRRNTIHSSAHNDMRCRQNIMASLDLPSCLCQREIPVFSDLSQNSSPRIWIISVWSTH